MVPEAGSFGVPPISDELLGLACTSLRVRTSSVMPRITGSGSPVRSMMRLDDGGVSLFIIPEYHEHVAATSAEDLSAAQISGG